MGGGFLRVRGRGRRAVVPDAWPPPLGLLLDMTILLSDYLTILLSYYLTIVLSYLPLGRLLLHLTLRLALGLAGGVLLLPCLP